MRLDSVQYNTIMVNFLLAGLPSCIFLFIKTAFMGIRFSDTNVYFYTAMELLKGKLLYKDIFFTNLPLFPYISSLYTLLIGKKLEMYYLTASIEVIITGVLMFFLVLKKTQNRLYAVATQCIYLFSFIILSTSDHQTGVFMASMFSIIAYFFYTKKMDIPGGIFLALMVLTKAYYISIVVAFFIYLIFKEKRRLIRFLLGFITTCIIVLLPFFIFAGRELTQDVIFYSLFRSQGINKLTLVQFFISHDLLLSLLLSFSLFLPNKNPLFFFIMLLSMLLLILYKDVYYLYLNILIPYIVLSFSDLIIQYCEKIKKYWQFIFPLAGIFLVINITTYFNQYATLQKLDESKEMAKIIKKENPEYLYGTMEVTPALAYLTGIHLLDNIIDTNDNLFYKGVLNTQTLTRRLFSKKTILAAKGMNYPSSNVYKPVSGPVIDEETVMKRCKKIFDSPIKTEGAINNITLFKCY